jgi:PRC-barrel domain
LIDVIEPTAVSWKTARSTAAGARLAQYCRMETAEARLRYIDGSKVETPGGLLDQLDVLNYEDSNVGRVEGIVVDPAERQVRYFVVKSRRPFRARHYLLPLAPATIDAENKALHVDVQADDLAELIDGPAKAFPPFTDDDLLDALFSNRTH